jgi:nitrite reductase/ring-hydroxylating ferredoxin subunit
MAKSAPMTSLQLAGIYRRTVAASLARVRENVLDWEHLPALHSGSFTACHLIDEDSDGWRIRLVGQNNPAPQTLKLHLASDTSFYRVITEAGPGATSEIRVAVVAEAEHTTRVVVEYHVPESDPQRLALIGKAFVLIYKQLWDEDEAMMQARERALVSRRRTPAKRLDLGSQRDLPLPHIFDWCGDAFRLVMVDSRLLAHAATCPHWLAPLDDVAIDDGCITCPWHGYRFDILSGLSVDGRGLRLRPAPRILVEDGRIIACM